jgi:hypothetical protein
MPLSLDVSRMLRSQTATKESTIRSGPMKRKRIKTMMRSRATTLPMTRKSMNTKTTLKKTPLNGLTIVSLRKLLRISLSILKKTAPSFLNRSIRTLKRIGLRLRHRLPPHFASARSRRSRRKAIRSIRSTLWSRLHAGLLRQHGRQPSASSSKHRPQNLRSQNSRYLPQSVGSASTINLKSCLFPQSSRHLSQSAQSATMAQQVSLQLLYLLSKLKRRRIRSLDPCVLRIVSSFVARLRLNPRQSRART